MDLIYLQIYIHTATKNVSEIWLKKKKKDDPNTYFT